MDALGLTEDQKRVIDTAMEEAVQRAERAARQQAVAAAKLEFRAGVAGSRRPDVYNPSTTNIATYFEGFEPFRAIMILNGIQAINTFLTYLDGPSRTTLVENNLTTLDDWDEFKAHAITVLSSPKAGVQARYELKRAVQKADESVADFGKRLIELGKVGYKPEEADARNSVLIDHALAGGTTDKQLEQYVPTMPKGSYQTGLVVPCS